MKKSDWALYDKQNDKDPKLSRNLSEACDKKPAMIPIVVGRLAAQTPSLLISASVPSASAKGLAQPKHPVSPGTMTWICPESALSETPD